MLTKKMYAVDEALLNEYRKGNKYPNIILADHTFAAIVRCGTLDEVREFVHHVCEDRKKNDYSWYPDMSILVTCGHEKLARKLRCECINNGHILACVYNNYGLSVTKKWVRIIGTQSHIYTVFMTHLADIGRLDDIDELADDFPDMDSYSLGDICLNLPAAKIIAAMSLKNTRLPAWCVGVRGDVDVYRRYIDTYEDEDGVWTMNMTNIIGGAIHGNSVSLIEELLKTEKEKVIEYLSTMGIGEIANDDNEAAIVMLYEHIRKDSMDWLWIIRANQMNTLRRIIADRRDCYMGDAMNVRAITIMGSKRVTIMINLLSMSHPPAIHGMIRLSKLYERNDPARNRFKEIAKDDGDYENIHFADIAKMLAWRPMITLAGRWSAVASPFLVDVAIIAEDM